MIITWLNQSILFLQTAKYADMNIEARCLHKPFKTPENYFTVMEWTRQQNSLEDTRPYFI